MRRRDMKYLLISKIRGLRKKDVWMTVGKIFILSIVVAAVILARYEQQYRSKAGTGPADLSISPSSQNVVIGANSIFSVYVNPKTSTVAGAQLQLTFDPTKIEITRTGITPGSFFRLDPEKSCGCDPAFMPDCEPQVIINNVTTDPNNPNRSTVYYAVSYALGSKMKDSSGNCTLPYASSQAGSAADISYTAKTSGQVQISFIEAGGTATVVTGPAPEAGNLTGVLSNGTIDVGSGTGGRLYFQPESSNGSVGDTFNVKLLADTAGNGVYGVDAKLIYNPSHLEVVSVNKGGTAGLSHFSVPTNSAGNLTIASNVGATGGSVKGVLDVATIGFRIKSSFGQTSIVFDYKPNGTDTEKRNDSNIVLADSSSTSDPTDILSSVGSYSVTYVLPSTPTPTPELTPQPTPVVTPTPTPTPTLTPTPSPSPTPTPIPVDMILEISLSFQGRLRAGPSNEKNLVIKYRKSGETAISTQNLATTSQGKFVLGLRPGIYTFLIEAPGYLPRKYSNIDITTSGSYLSLINQPLLGGDFNGDGIVNSFDFSWFIDKYGTADDLYDLDGSGEVNTLDYVVMKTNWSMLGDSF